MRVLRRENELTGGEREVSMKQRERARERERRRERESPKPGADVGDEGATNNRALPSLSESGLR